MGAKALTSEAGEARWVLGSAVLKPNHVASKTQPRPTTAARLILSGGLSPCLRLSVGV